MKTSVCSPQIPSRIHSFFRVGSFVAVIALALYGGVAKAAVPLVSNVSRFTIIDNTSYREEDGALLRNGEFRLRYSLVGGFAPGDKEQLELINGRTVMWVEAYQINQNAGVIPNWVTHSVAAYPFGTLDYFILGAKGHSDPNPLPVFTEEPDDQLAAVGDFVVFGGLAQPDSLISYQWLKNGRPIPGETDVIIIISDCSKADAGKYALRASIGGSVAVSRTATLKILAPVFVKSVSKDVSVQVGRTVALRAFVTGARPIVYQWFHDGQAIVGATSSHLTLRRVGAADDGYYYVRVSNAVSHDLSPSIDVTVTQ